MPPFFRSLLAVVAGAVGAFGLISAVQVIGSSLYPLPAGMDPTNREAMSAYVATLPIGAFLMVLLSYALGGLGGGFVAAKLASTARFTHAGVIAILLIAAAVMNLMTFSHPVWFWVANILVLLLFPRIGARLAISGGSSDGRAPVSH